MDADGLKLGAHKSGDGTRFLVWAPRAEHVELRLLTPFERLVEMQALGGGYFTAECADVLPGARYFYRLPGPVDRPDPVSRFQPDGVHGPSQVVWDEFDWRDATWRGLDWIDYVLYELHVGTFTRGGTMDDIIGELAQLKDLGVTAIELMPVGEFPGKRNWGYDGAYPFAVHSAYGGPLALKRLVDACHEQGMAVVLDVVYNHLGPEGNYLGDFGPYFTDRYRTNWGSALNFDGPHSDAVRRYFVDNALMWIDEFHIDALRLDAVHAIFDFSARPMLRELARAVHQRAEHLGRQIYVIVETNLNDPKLLEPVECGGLGLDAQWLDDFQRAAHAALTGETQGYYCDFGGLEPLAAAFREGYVLKGQYSRYRGRCYGADSSHLPPTRFIAFVQNHDQVGNRGRGERIGHLVDFESQKLAAALAILSPYTPLLFMGEEYGEAAPFFYFTSHLDPALVEAVRSGRAQDLARFQQQYDAPDPQAVETFERSRVDLGLSCTGRHRSLWRYYRELLRLRKSIPPLRLADRHMTRVMVIAGELLLVERYAESTAAVCLFHFGADPRRLRLDALSRQGAWEVRLDSAAGTWGGADHHDAPKTADRGELEIAGRSCILLAQPR